MLVMLLSACALITEAEYDERLGNTEPPFDSEDSGELPLGAELSGSLSVPSDRNVDMVPTKATVGLVHARFVQGEVEPGEEFVTLGDVLAWGVAEDLTVGASRPYKFDIPATPDPEGHYALQNAFASGSTWMLGAWLDRDGDQAPSNEDIMVGANIDQILVYVEETADDGVFDETGWFLVSFEPDTGELTDVFTVDDIVAYDLSANLVPNANANQRFTAELKDGLDDGVHDPMFTLFDLSLLDRAAEGEDLERNPYLATTDIGSSGGINFPSGIGVPAPEQMIGEYLGVSYVPYGVEVGIFFGLAWDDTDGDGEVDLKIGPNREEFLGTSLQPGQAAQIITYYRPVSLKAAYMEDAGIDAGWNRFRFDDDQEILDWDTMMVLDDASIGD